MMTRQERLDLVHAWLTANVPHGTRPDPAEVASAVRMSTDYVRRVFNWLREAGRWDWKTETLDERNERCREGGRLAHDNVPPTEDEILERSAVERAEWARSLPIYQPKRRRRPGEPWDFAAERKWRERYVADTITRFLRSVGGSVGNARARARAAS